MKPERLVVHWSRFGPYHLARIRAAWKFLREHGVEGVGLETASQDDVYQWRNETAPELFVRKTLFPSRSLSNIGARELRARVRAELDDLQPKTLAICGYGSPDALACLEWSRRHRCAAILMTESKVDDGRRVAWVERIKARVVAHFDAVLCGGTPQRAYVRRLGFPEERIFTGYDAVDNDYFSIQAKRARMNPASLRSLPGLESDSPFFLASCRFIPRKNLDTLLCAYSTYRLKAQAAAPGLPVWRLVILGDGAERRRIEAMIRDQRIPEVTLPGFRQIDEIPYYYGAAGAFVHPARQEPWGLVVNEAMACGLPVLVSRTCGCSPDLVLQGRTGFTFNPESVGELTSLLVRISGNPSLREAIGRAARQHIEGWGPDRFAEGLDQARRAAHRAACARGTQPLSSLALRALARRSIV
jgi:glycosyltransferase involved in cell wall biosynthesis